MAKRAVNVPPIAGTTLPHDWRADGWWKVTASLWKIPTADYLPTARAFEVHHIAAGTVSTNWRAEWKAWCQRALAPPVEPEEAPGLFG